MPKLLSVAKTGSKTVTLAFDAAVTAASATAASFKLSYNSGSAPISATSVSQNGANALDVTAATWPTDPTGQPFWIKGTDSTPFYAGILATTYMGFVANPLGAALLAAVAALTAGQTLTLTAANYDIGEFTLPIPLGATVLGVSATSSTLTSHHLGTFVLNGSTDLAVGIHAIVAPGVNSFVGSLTINCPDASWRSYDVVNGIYGAAAAVYQFPIGTTDSDPACTGATASDINIHGNSDAIYFKPGTVSHDISMTFIRVNATANFDTFNIFAAATGTVTLRDCALNSVGPSFDNFGIVRCIRVNYPVVVNVINPMLWASTTATSSDNINAVLASNAGTVNLSGTGSVTLLSTGATAFSLRQQNGGIAATLNVASKTVIYDQTLTSGTIGGDAGTIGLTVSAILTWVAFTGTHHYTLKLNNAQQGGTLSGATTSATVTLTAPASNVLLLTAFDSAAKAIATARFLAPTFNPSASGIIPWTR